MENFRVQGLSKIGTLGKQSRKSAAENILVNHASISLSSGPYTSWYDAVIYQCNVKPHLCTQHNTTHFVTFLVFRQTKISSEKRTAL
jgi:hypothetical protein